MNDRMEKYYVIEFCIRETNFATLFSISIYIYMYFERVMKYPGVAFNLCVISVTGGKQEFCLQFNQLHRVYIRPVPDKFITILARSDTRSDTRDPWRRNCIRRRFVLYIHRAS